MKSGLFSDLPLSWWGKFIGMLVALIFCLAFTLPTFLGDPKTWPRVESGAEAGQPVNWYHRLAETVLPSSRVSLGLDLKGGLHLVLEVDVEQSIRDSIARSVNRAKDSLLEQGLKAEIPNVAEDYATTLTIEDPSKQEDFVKAVSTSTQLIAFNRMEGNTLYFTPNQTRIGDYTGLILQQAINTIRNRIDQFGVAEPSIVQQGTRRIVVQMPGLQDTGRAKELIGNTAQLDFRLVLNEVSQDRLDGLLDEARTATSIAKEDTKPETIAKLSQWLRDNKKISTGATIMLSRTYTNDGGAATLSGTVPYLVEAQPKLTGDLIDDAQVVQTSNNIVPELAVSLAFKPQGAKLFGELTKTAFEPKNAPHQIAIVLDQNVNSAPVVNEPILTGNAQITLGRGSANYDDKFKEAQDLALVLRAGALPATVRVVEERQIGPSEGEENIRAGLTSSLLAALVTIIAMIVIYGNSGLIANFAMLFNALLILAFLAAFGATLTLPGIAGIVLTMAVAVDGNIIINERIREEIRSGHTPKQAFYMGYNASFMTLVDAHVTSAVAGLVLLIYGNPAVKGFAITLMCGIVSTLFTSYYVTEVIGQWLIEKTGIKRFS